MNRPYFAKKRKEQGFAFPFPFGLSLLFVSFLALCIFTFAVLSLLTAQNDYKISRKNAEHQSAYYEASNEAEDRIAELNAELEKAGENGEKISDRVAFQVDIDSESVLSVVLEAKQGNAADNAVGEANAANEAAGAGNGADQAAGVGNAADEAAGAGQSGESSAAHYEVTEWKVVSTGDWSPSETIPVMTPGVSG